MGAVVIDVDDREYECRDWLWRDPEFARRIVSSLRSLPAYVNGFELTVTRCVHDKVLSIHIPAGADKAILMWDDEGRPGHMTSVAPGIRLTVSEAEQESFSSEPRHTVMIKAAERNYEPVWKQWE